MYFFLAFELNIILRIFLRVRYFRTILALPVVDPGEPSMCLCSGPVSNSGVNEGLVPCELFWFIVKLRSFLFYLVLDKLFSVRLSDHGGSGLVFTANSTCSHLLCVAGNPILRWSPSFLGDG